MHTMLLLLLLDNIVHDSFSSSRRWPTLHFSLAETLLGDAFKIFDILTRSNREHSTKLVLAHHHHSEEDLCSIADKFVHVEGYRIDLFKDSAISVLILMGHTVNDRLVLLFLISQNFDISWSGADHGAPITVLTAVIWR